MPSIEIISIEGHSLLIVSVSRWRGPFYLKSKGETDGTYIRLGSTNRKAGSEILEEIKRQNTKKTFDQAPCLETNSRDLDMDQIKEVFLKVGKEINKSKLKTMGLLVEYNGRLICSKFIDRNTKLSSEIKTSHRMNIPEYSPLIVREVLINALAHADYSLRGLNPRVSIFSDRLEIESPGMLPLGYLLEDFFSGVSHIRNKVIARVFRELNLMEEWGTGFKRIKYVCDQENYPLPNWEEIGPIVKVSLKPHDVSLATNTKDSMKISSVEEKELTTRQEEIVQLLKEHGALATKDLHKKLTCSISERTLRGDLTLLKKNNIIKMLGKGPATQWKIS